MLGLPEINGKIMSMGRAIRAQVSYELNMSVNFGDFFFLKMQKDSYQESFLNYNLYKQKL